MTSGPRPVRAARGSELTCRGWQQEAALRMLMNNLDPEVAENPDALVVYGGTGRAARGWGALHPLARAPPAPRGEEKPLPPSGEAGAGFRAPRRGPRGPLAHPQPVGQAGRRVPDPRMGAAGPHRQLEPGREVGDLGCLSGPRAARPDDVRPDDRRVLDLHRDPGDLAGHVRDVRGAGPSAFRRDAR